MNDGGPAFPHAYKNPSMVEARPYAGMSLRDYFAGQAMKALLTGSGLGFCNHKPISELSYQIAEAMIEERDRRGRLNPDWISANQVHVGPPPSHPDNPTLKK